MNENAENQGRASRLLRWYPPAWRERYGEEFSAHLEQEFEERSVDLKRTFNVIYKGIVARIGDLGFARGDASLQLRTRSALGTSALLLIVSTALTLYFWSMSMLVWSSREFHPVPIDLTTGVLTVVMALLGILLIVMIGIVAYAAVRQTIRGRGRRIALPAFFAGASGAFILVSVRWVTKMFRAYTALRPHGFRWIHPGPAAYGLASIASRMTAPWVAIWNPGISGEPTSQHLMNDFGPLAIVIFAVSMAFLVRRVELPRFNDRLGHRAVVAFGGLMGIFLLATVLWLLVGGPSDFRTFGFTGNVAGVAYLLFFGLVVVLSFRLAQNSRERHQPPQIHVEATSA